MTTKEILEKVLEHRTNRNPIISKVPKLEGHRLTMAFTTYEYFRENMTENEVKKLVRQLVLEIAELAILDARNI